MSAKTLEYRPQVDRQNTQAPSKPKMPLEPSLKTDGRPLFSRSFVGLLSTQFLGTLNENMFRWLAVPLGKELIGSALALTLGAICFLVPYPILAAPAGYLADRFSKRTVIVGCKAAEIVLMVLGIAGLLSGSLTFLFVVVTLMGAQSALF